MARILHLLSEDLSTGTLKQIELLCQGLAEFGFEQSICSVEPNQQRRANLPSFTGRISFCRHNWTLDPTFLVRLRRQLAQDQPALIQTWGGRAGSIGMWLAALHGETPIVRGIRSFENESSSVPVLNRWLSRQATRVIVNNDLLKASLTSRGVPSNLIDVVVNAVEPSVDFSSAGSLHRELGLDDSIRFIAVAGDLRTKKRIKDLIWAMDLLRVIRPEMHLLIIGEGEELDLLQKFDRDVNLDPCVHFLGRHRDVRDLLAQCSFFWQASRDEGCSNAVLEAMSVGLPVVASDIPGHQPMVVPGETGYLVPLGDCAEFARKTNWLIQNEVHRQEIGIAGQRFVNQHYSVEQMIDGYQSIYQSVLTSRSEQAA